MTARKFRYTGERHVRMRPEMRDRERRGRRGSNGLLARESTPVYQGTYFGIKGRW